ncbi:MAG: alpha/beta fold hydrolase [Flectobacillus sp.]|uniref:alpha/beta fold hydrolase n=1 Tax=Flectobacillus sp. TaxID=50419 RepID=UPI003B9BE1BF
MIQKKVVVLLHGFGEDSTVWLGIVPYLQKSLLVFTPDYAKETALKTMDEYADFVAKQLQEAGVSQCTVIGHSMGGYIALAFAEKYPNMITGLGLFHSTAYGDSEERKALRLKNVDFLKTHGTEVFIKNFTPNLYSEEFNAQNPEVVQKHIDYSSQLPVEALMVAMDAMRIRPDRREILANAKYPVMMIIGKKDKSIPVADALEQLALASNTSSLVLDTVGHMGMYEEPEECVRFIKKFLLK